MVLLLVLLLWVGASSVVLRTGSFILWSLGAEEFDSSFWLMIFASYECLAQRRLPTRAELFGGFSVRHEEVEPVVGTTHDQEFGCDVGMDKPPRIFHVFFSEQVNRADADPGRR